MGDTANADLREALMATGLLWPLRQPIRDFDLEVIGGVNQLLGANAKLVLRVVQTWGGDDMLSAARQLADQMAASAGLQTAIGLLLEKFNAAEQVAVQLQQPGAPAPESAPGSAPPTTAAPQVFISYARSDGEAIAADLRRRLEAEGISVWQDRVKMVGGRDWWLQITDALNQVEFMVLAATTGAIESEIVRKEWRYARQQGVCVYPVLVEEGFSFERLPRWMRNVHFYNIKLEWAKLLRDLKAPCQTPRVPFMAEELPADFVPRPDVLTQATRLLLNEQLDPIAGRLALAGTGGFGKTMLARAICHNEDIRQGFDEGVLWVTLGEDPGDLTSIVVDLIEVLTGDRPGFASLDAAETQLGQILADRDILMVLDDVWNVAHLRPFLRGGARCARLITTRDIAALPPNTQKIEVGAMPRPEAIALLRRGLPPGSLRPFEELSTRLGGWPLLLGLVNGTLRDRISNGGQSLESALAYANRALDKRGLTAFDTQNAAARDQAVGQTLAVNQELLSETERQRYAELAIFPPDVNIPLNVLQLLWGATGGLDDFDTEELCYRLHQLSLLAHFDPNSQVIQLHNIVRTFLTHQHEADIPGWQQQFLDGWAARLLPRPSQPHRWANLPHQAAYQWNYLAYHLLKAGRVDELVATVKDLGYLITKTYLRTATAAEADLLAARQAAPDDAELNRLHQAFSQASHLLSECTSLNEISGTLHSRIAHFSGLEAILQAAAANLPKPFFTAHQRLPDLPDASLIRTLVGHGQVILSCAISADGATILSIDREAGVKIWDARTGAERYALAGHVMLGNACALSADGAVAVSAAWDGVIKVWDTQTGRERLNIEAHEGPIFAVAVSADGAVVVSASKDKTVKVWDGRSGACRHVLSEHTRSVTGCHITGDGRTIASISTDGTLKVWDAASGALKHNLEAFALDNQNPIANLTFTASASALFNCALSGDGRTLVATLPDGVFKVWDLPSETVRYAIKGHHGWIENCAISSDASLIVTASNDKTLKGWHADSGRQKFTMEGHMRSVTGCAVSADGALVLSCSQDKTLKLWTGDIEEDPGETERLTSPVQCCAVSANGQRLIFDGAGNVLRVLDAATGEEQQTLKGHGRPITGCAISANGSTIVTASQDRTLKIWDAATGIERATLLGHMWAVSDCNLSDDGSLIVSVSDDSTVKVWDAATGTERFNLPGHMRGVNGCAIAPDNSVIISASADKSLKVWDSQTGQEKFTLSGHDGPVNNCAVSHNGRWLASVSNDDTVRLWNLHSGEFLFTLAGHQSSVLECAFHPNDGTLLSVSKDKTIKLWDLDSRQCLATLRVDGSLARVAWYPDGERCLVAGNRGIYMLRVIW
ncbi:MAG: hypothetical protein Kow0031_19680 [Anaerolineae bacterium]